MKFGWCTILIVFLSGCTVGPDYSPPEMDIPCDWHSPLSDGMEQSTEDTIYWWQTLNDPLLDCLIENAAFQNLDMQIAAARIVEARAARQSAFANFFPFLNASTSFNHVYFSEDALFNSILSSTAAAIPNSNGTIPGFKRSVDFYEVGFDVEWEIDLFGANRREYNARQALLESDQENLRNVWVSLTAEIARTYIELRGYQYKLDILRKNIDAQQLTADIMQDRLQSGMTNQLDLDLAEEQLYSLKARETLLEHSKDRTIYRISILLGNPPGEFYDELNVPSPLPEMPYDKPIGIPSELLRRRPDIRQAERKLASDTEFVGEAVANLFPKFSLLGFIGQVSTQLNKLTAAESTAWFINNSLVFPIFNSGKLVQEIRINEAKAQRSLLDYKKTVLTALEESENALGAFHYEMKRNQYLFKAFKSYGDAYQREEDLYQKGFKNYLLVADALQKLLTAEDEYAQSSVDLLTNFVALYKSLGGGWEMECENNTF